MHICYFKMNQTQMGSGFLKKYIELLIFIIISWGHIQCGLITSTDSRSVIPSAISLVSEGNFELTEFPELTTKIHSVEEINGKRYNWYPMGEPILAAPLVYLLTHAFDENLVYISYLKVEKLVASVIVAICGIIVFHMLLAMELNFWTSFIGTMIFAFATSALSTGSRAMWQHAPTMLCILATIRILQASERKASLIQYAAFPVAFSYVCRPTNSIFVLLMTGFVFWKYRSFFIPYMIIACLIAISFIALNLYIHGNILSSYYRISIASNRHFFSALFAILISPNRGFFFWHPLFVFSVLGVWIAFTKRTVKSYETIFLCHFLIFSLIIASFSFWWGSHSVGPRFYTDMVPYGIYFLGLFLKELATLAPIAKRLSISFLTLTVLTSTSIHVWAASNTKPMLTAMDWNVYPNNIDLNIERIWDINDLQFLRGTDFALTSGEMRYKMRDTAATFNLKLREIKLKEEMAFNSPDTVIKFDDGWSSAEGKFRWSIGSSCGIFFNIDESMLNQDRTDVKLEVFAESNKMQKITVLLNGHRLCRQTLNGGRVEEIKCSFAKKYLRSDTTNYLVFDVSNPSKPNKFDQRDLGLALYGFDFK